MGKIESHTYRGIEHVVPPSRLIGVFVDRLVDHYVRDLRIQGGEHLEKAREISELAGTGIVFAGNHLSNADYPVLIRALRMSGFTDPYADTVAILGIRLYGNLLSRIGIGVAPHIKVYPPTETPKSEEEEKGARTMNLNAFRAQRKVLEKGMHTVVFPQGGREQGEITRIPPPQIAGFFEYGVVLPLGLNNTNKILPKGKIIPVQAAASITFGEPFLGRDLRIKFADLSRDERRVEMVNYVMIGIAKCLPLEYRGIYAQAVEKSKEPNMAVLMESAN